MPRLKLTSAARRARYSSIDFGTNFDTALDSQGVLHAAWYDAPSGGRLMYATRDDRRALVRRRSVVDNKGDVGAMPTIAVDTTGKAGDRVLRSHQHRREVRALQGTARGPRR